MDNDAVEELIRMVRACVGAGPITATSHQGTHLLEAAAAAEEQLKQEREALENFEAVKRNRDGLMRRYGECQQDVAELIQLNAQKDADLAEERERVGRLQRALAHRLAYTAGEIRSLEKEREEQKQAERVVEVRYEDGGWKLNGHLISLDVAHFVFGDRGSGSRYAISRLEPEPEQSKDSGVSEMRECPHWSMVCNCGAAPNSPDCRGEGVEVCALTEESCDYRGERADVQDCWRYQERRADAAEDQPKWEREGERVVEVIVATTPRNGMEEVHMLVFHKPGGQCLGVPVTNWPGFSHAWSLAKILGLPSSAGCYHLALHRLEPEPEKPKVRPWRLKTGTIICPLCHEILKRNCGDDPNILPPCFGCEASFGEPRELAVSDG